MTAAQQNPTGNGKCMQYYLDACFWALYSYILYRKIDCIVCWKMKVQPRKWECGPHSAILCSHCFNLELALQRMTLCYMHLHLPVWWNLQSLYSPTNTLTYTCCSCGTYVAVPNWHCSIFIYNFSGLCCALRRLHDPRINLWLVSIKKRVFRPFSCMSNVVQSGNCN